MTLRALVAGVALTFVATPLFGVGTSPLIPGLRSSGTIVVQATVQGSPVNVDGNVALYHKGPLYRLDLLSLAGSDASASALATTMIGPGGASVVYNGATGETIVWSATTRSYYVLAPAQASGTNAAASGATPAPSDPLSALARIAQALQNAQSASIQLVGHRTVNGHPATDVDVILRRQLPGKPPEDYRAQVALADDLGDFPLQIAFSSNPGSPSTVGGSFKLDLTTIQREVPDDRTFAVPQGYTRATALSGVLSHGRR